MMRQIEPVRGLGLGPDAQNACHATKLKDILKTMYKILVADDEPDAVRGLKILLSHAGYDVITAGNGQIATELAFTRQPDLIVLDIGMPGGDGHVVARRILDNPKTKCIPIIFLTARTHPQDQCRAADAGIVAYITKPYTTERLLMAVARALNPDGLN